MKQYSLIYLKDWPELLALNTEHRALRRKYGPNRWANLFHTKKNAEAIKRMDQTTEEFVNIVRTEIRRRIPIGSHPNEYDWQYNSQIQAIIWGRG